MKECSECGESKVLSAYYTRSSRCIVCHNEYTRQHYQDNKSKYVAKAKRNNQRFALKVKNFLREYFAEHHCVDCGMSDIRTLDFDHRDPKMKEFNIGSCWNQVWSFRKILAEIEKCDVRCANCHRIRTSIQFGTWRDAEPV